MQSAAARNIDRIGYDLSRFDKRRRVREALSREKAVYEPIPMPKVVSEEKIAEQAKVRANVRAETAVRRRVSVFSVFSYIAVTALMILIVFNYMTLNELSIQSSGLKRELAALKEEAAVLQVQHERTTDLRLLETNAAALGMTKATSGQITYIDLSMPDHTVISNGKAESSDFIAGLKVLFSSVIEYFN